MTFDLRNAAVRSQILNKENNGRTEPIPHPFIGLVSDVCDEITIFTPFWTISALSMCFFVLFFLFVLFVFLMMQVSSRGDSISSAMLCFSLGQQFVGANDQ